MRLSATRLGSISGLQRLISDAALLTQSGDQIVTQSNDFISLEQANQFRTQSGDLIVTQSNDFILVQQLNQLRTQSGDLIVTQSNDVILVNDFILV